MTRLQKLIKLVEQEQELVRQGADCEQLCRHQDRLLQHLSKTGRTCAFELFTIPEAAVETGIVSSARRSRDYSHQGTITGRFTSNTPNFKEVDRPAGVWNQPTEEESDMERDRR